MKSVLHCFYYVGATLMAFSGAMLLPIGVSVVRGTSALPFLFSFLVTFFSGWMINRISRRPHVDIRRRDGIFIVVVTWLLISVAGALPYLFAGSFGSLSGHVVIDALFESVSGFSTTGASILHHIESLPGDILLWRSLTQWLGGMGIILLVLAILPFLGVAGLELYRAEVAGPTKDKFKAHVTETAKTFFYLYILMTALCFSALLVAGMPAFDAICHALSTLATGGFSVRNASIGAYGSPAFEWIIIFFMFFAAANFQLHYQFLKGDGVGAYFKNEEFRVYISIWVLAILSVVAARWHVISGAADVHPAIRDAAFMVTSFMTSTGFLTADYEQWPYVTQMLFFILMAVGGCAGSTAGGIKMVRSWIIIKHAANEIYRVIHPQSISVVKFNDQRVSVQTLSAIFGFFVAYVVVFGVACILLTMFGLDMRTSMFSVVSSMGAFGPGLNLTGPAANYGMLHPGAKITLSVCMIMGRLELITFAAFFFPAFWKR